MQNHIININHLSKKDIISIIDDACKIINNNNKTRKKLSGSVVSLFFEPSTRTRVSFAIAADNVGMNNIDVSIKDSSINKGESIKDTIMSMIAMQPACVVIRTKDQDIFNDMSLFDGIATINAGHGASQHPTQALLDAATILHNKGTLDNLKIAICGDIAHSRVARSFIDIMQNFSSEIRLIAPRYLQTKYFNLDYFDDVSKGVEDCDVIMTLRLQKERMSSQLNSLALNYKKLYRLSHDNISSAKNDVIIMHPGPVNREIEITGQLVDDTRKSVVMQQVAMGIATRMACFKWLFS
jgi:aspartate carbamoyltransferase catalytic subunit